MTFIPTSALLQKHGFAYNKIIGAWQKRIPGPWPFLHLKAGARGKTHLSQVSPGGEYACNVFCGKFFNEQSFTSLIEEYA